MTSDELREIEERCEKATEGPWKSAFIPEDLNCVACPVDHWDIFREVCKVEKMGTNDYVVDCSVVEEWNVACIVCKKPDADFIVHARDDIPELLAHVRELREALKPFNREAKKILKTPMGIRNLVTAKFLDSELNRATAAYGGDE